jgi:hypothetical protein
MDGGGKEVEKGRGAGKGGGKGYDVLSACV